MPSDAPDSTAAPPPALPVTLNMNAAGTTADLRELRQMIGDIMRNRESNGVFREGSAEIENTVYVNTDDRLNIGALGDILLAINESGGKAYLPVNEDRLALPDVPTKPNPLTLMVSVGLRMRPISRLDMEGTEASQYAVSPSVEIISNWKDVKHKRAVGSSLEISATGDYYLNGPTIYLSTDDIEDVEVAQRSLDASSLSTAIPALRGTEGIKIIASEFAPVSSLVNVLKAVDATKYKWIIVVKRAEPNQKRKQ